MKNRLRQICRRKSASSHALGRRCVSLLLCLCMVLTFLPVSAFATPYDENTRESNPFHDVQSGDWYYDAVQYVRLNGFFNGTSNTSFTPDGTMTRGMFVTVLGRMAGVDTANYSGVTDFSDVPERMYYAPYVAWAAKYGITDGTGDGNFSPDALITRQQMAVFFVRYFETFDVNYGTGANITTTPADMDSVAPYAKDAVRKLWATGLLAGDGVNFDPNGNATRAQAATLCMRTDETVETWYSEPGVPSRGEPPAHENETDPEPVFPIFPPSESTAYYRVTFHMGSATDSAVYKSGTLLSAIPIASAPAGKVFVGWCKDSGCTQLISGTDRLTGDLTLYAKYADTAAPDQTHTPNFVSAMEQESLFSITLQKSAGSLRRGTDFRLSDLSAPELTDTVAGNGETVIVISGAGSDLWTVAATGGFVTGHTYQLELLSKEVAFDDTAAAFDALKVSGYDLSIIRFFNFSIENNGTLNLTLDRDIVFLPASELGDEDRSALFGDTGLVLASVANSDSAVYADNRNGQFSYTGETTIQIGDVVAIYEGTHPLHRKTEKDNGSTNNGDMVYIRITAVEAGTYSYEAAKAEDILFTPDVFPVDVDGWPTFPTVASGNLTVEEADLGLDAATTVDEGDFMAFYTGELATGALQSYARITAVTDSGGDYEITYEVVDETAVTTAMDLYDEVAPSAGEVAEAVESAQDEITATIQQQLYASDFFDEVGLYLAALAMETDEVTRVFGAGLTPSDYTVSYADGTSIGEQDIMLLGNIVDLEQEGNRPSVSVDLDSDLVHFDDDEVGVRAEVAVSYLFRIQKQGSQSSMDIELTTFFEQEVILDFSVSGGAVWKTKYGFLPYIDDYRMNANLDVGSYTGVAITATATLTGTSVTQGMSWPERVDQAGGSRKVIELSEAIQKKMDAESALASQTTGGLAEKYAVFMQDANTDWVDLVCIQLVKLHGAVDPFHVLAYGLDVKFLVSANMNVALGMTFQYENLKRHSFTLTVFDMDAESETIDLSTNGYQFDCYVMGALQMRAGILAKATAGLFSTKLDAVGLLIEGGVCARMWGFFYYSLENWRQPDGGWGKSDSSVGAMLVEIGLYLDVHFIAEALNGKYAYMPVLYAREWPLMELGQRLGVYDFAYDNGSTFTIWNVCEYTLPSAYFEMYEIDLKTGTYQDKGYRYRHVYDDDLFAVEFSNPNFRYSHKTGQILIDPNDQLNQTSEMTITWKGGPLGGTGAPLRRVFTVEWRDAWNVRFLSFDTKGGSSHQDIVQRIGSPISLPVPTRFGYEFAGWYRDWDCTVAFTSDTMPEESVMLFAKWEPAVVTYTVEHYRQELNGSYTKAEETVQSAAAGSFSNADALTYDGFAVSRVKNCTVEADGSAAAQIYYDRLNYTLTFNYEDRQVISTVPYGTPLVEPNAPTREGYVFAGWKQPVPETMPADHLCFTATWEPANNTPYTVYHYLQESSGRYELVETEYKTGTTGGNTSASAKAYPGFTARTFEQKNIVPNGSGFVQIYYTRNLYPLTWHTNGGALPSAGYTAAGPVPFGAVITAPAPTKADYAFVGWYTDEELTQKWPSGRTMPVEALTLYAKWTEDGYTVSFNANSVGDITGAMEPLSFAYNEEKVLTPNAFVRAGHSFTGWNTKADGSGTAYADGQIVMDMQEVVDRAVTLYAQWQINTYTVTWKNEDGTVLKAETLAYGTTPDYGEPPTKTRIGYTCEFAYWSPDIYAVSTDTVYTAVFYETPNQYTVTLDANGGIYGLLDGPANQVDHTVIFGEYYGNLSHPQREGYSFISWNTASNGSGITVTGDSVLDIASDHTLYAQWLPEATL